MSQSPARRAHLENSTHLADASSLNGMLTNCFDLERSEKEGGNKRCGSTLRALSGPLNKGRPPGFSLLNCHGCGSADPFRLEPLQGHVAVHVPSIKRTRVITAPQSASWFQRTNGQINKMIQKRPCCHCFLPTNLALLWISRSPSITYQGQGQEDQSFPRLLFHLQTSLFCLLLPVSS